MKININSLLTLFGRKNKKCLYFLFFLTSHLFFAQIATTQIVTKIGAGTFMVPCDVTSITVELWGGGGAGGGSTTSTVKGGGGGAGGAYVSSILAVTPGSNISYIVGAGGVGALTAGASGGDSSFSTLLAKGGLGGAAPNGGTVPGGTSQAGSVGTTIILGTNGGDGSATASGAGGAGGLGGAGGTGLTAGNNGSAGSVPGGGGGGAFVNNVTNRSGGNGGNGQIKISYTTKYCAKNFTSSIEPITNVTFAGINNTSSGTINGSAANEFFCATSASVLRGDTYSISLSGNTNGNNTNYFRVYIDWDQNGVFGNLTNEIYDIGTITNVTSGAVTGIITVPAGALLGNTTMRVVKNKGAYADACTTATNGQTEDYTIIVSSPTCSAVGGGTAMVSPSTGNPSSVFTASVSGSSNNTVAYTYQWEKSPDNTNWSIIPGATTPTATITSESSETTYYYRRKITCISSGDTYYSTSTPFTTVVTYCTPTFNTSNTGRIYIRSFRYIGVLNDEYLSTNISTQTGANGEYQNFTGITPIAEQVRGSVINVEAISTGTDTSSGTAGWGRWMAWIDWNNDGVFSSTEVVYSLQDYSTGSVTFGVIIPSNQALGNYRLRISVMSATSTNPCGLTTSYGEVEDYLFKVVEDNNAKLDTTKPNVFFRCGAGEVPMIVYGADANAISFKWYDTKYGGNLLNVGATYSPTISSTTTYYVTAVDSNGKETPFRYPIIARIDPQPEVVFSPTPQTICGEDDPSLLLSVGGDSRQVVLLDERFDTGLGAFVSVKEDTFVDTYNTPAYSPDWVMKPSPLAPKNPPHLAIASSIASGYFGGNFAIMNSDVRRNVSVKRHLVSTATYDTTPFLPNKIKLNFDLYYFSIALVEADGYIKVEYSLDGTTWSAIKTYVTNQGNPLIWNSVSLDLDALGVPRSSNLKIRFSVFSRGFGTTVGYYENVATLDNIKLYGDVPLDRDFNWSGLDNAVLYDKTCTTPLGNTLAREVCVKPPLDEFEKPFWTFSASATFENGCPAVGTTVVYNDTKVWREPGMVDWNQGDKWKPSTVPDIKKCVIIRTPVELPTNTTGTHGLARSVIVKSGGSLMIKPKSSLEIQNYIKNEGVASDVVVDSDANLKQNNDVAINIGDITVKRTSNMRRLDYTYWGTPVKGQNMRNFSPNTLISRFYVYNELNNYFDGVFVQNLYPTGTYSLTALEDPITYNFIEGKGYAIRAPNNYTTTNANFEGVFVGIPNNGDITFNLNKNGLGINLISNPYPSNINFEAFYNLNKDKIDKIAYFWTNTNYNPQMQGSSYPIVGYVNNYAVYTGVGGVSAPYGFDPSRPPIITPNNIIKPGQGFLVRAHTPGIIHFYNVFRDKSNDGMFFNSAKTLQTGLDRYWLELKTPLNFVSPLLVGYVDGSTNNFDVNFDAPVMVEGADSFYTVLEERKLVVEGRKYPLNQDDIVILGATYYEAGIHEISLQKAEGIFTSEQQIYLWDKKENIFTNLSNGSYKFYADQGDDKTRFQIVYKPASTLETDEVQKNDVIVYKNADDIIVEAGELIERVTVFDTSGKLIKKLKGNSKKLIIEGHTFKNGMWILEVKTSKAVTTKKIIK